MEDGKPEGCYIDSEGKGTGSFEDYKGATVLVMKEGRAFTIVDNNYMGADRKETVHYWIDRLERERKLREQAPAGQARRPELAAGEPLKRAFERLDTNQPILFVCSNGRRELAGLLMLMPEGRPRDVLKATAVAAPAVLSLSGQLRGINNLDAQLTLLLECSDAQFAAGLHERLEELLSNLPDSFPLQEVKLTREGGTVLRLEARIEDFPDKVARMVTYLIRRQEKEQE